MLEILEFADVEIHRATAGFSANGKQYPAGSYVIKTAQPYGAFAKTMLEKQVYPDLRLFPGGPPEPPYDVTGHTLWMLMGVTVDQVDKAFDAPLELVKAVQPITTPAPARPRAAYLVGPESYGVFKLVAELQKANLPTFRAGAAFDGHPAGTIIIPSTPASQKIVEQAAGDLGLVVSGADRMPAVDGFRLKPGTRVGLWKGAGNMPGGWLMWVLEQYGINHEIVKSQDFSGDLNAKYDVILLPSGTSKARIVNGLDPKRNDPAEWSWAYGVGETGWAKLRTFVENGGTLLAIGSAVETARELLDLPIEKALPEAPPRFGHRGVRLRPYGRDGEPRAARRVQRPARLMQTLRDRVADPTSLFFCPGSLLQNEFDTSNPVAWGMPEAWPIFFESDQAYRLRPGFGIDTKVVSRYPRENILQSGWLLGEEYLKDQANVVSFRLGKGYVVTYGSQVDFRAQPRATFRLVFNAMFHGPSTPVTRIRWK
jgi:hypothetical protein